MKPSRPPNPQTKPSGQSAKHIEFKYSKKENKKKAIDTLTIVNTIFLPLALITGYFGMNFKSMGAPSNKTGIFTLKYGQGFVLANPLQLANMTAIIASNGNIIEPKIINDSITTKFNNLNKYQGSIKIIKNSMFKVVNETKGTAFKSKSDEIIFSGKTGTSQVRRITVAERESEDFRKKEVEWKKRDHALFVGYMPVENPRYAVSVVIEHGGSGASTAAPIAKEIFQFTKNLEI